MPVSRRTPLRVRDGDRCRTEMVLGDGDTNRKRVCRARIIHENPHGNRTMEVMSRVGPTNTTILRWQDGSALPGTEYSLSDATWPLSKAPLRQAGPEK